MNEVKQTELKRETHNSKTTGKLRMKRIIGRII
jgi:hypothetical protein